MLVGQERAEAILSRAVSQSRVSHAYLFAGPDAVGKNTAALLFAQALNCDRVSEEARGRGREREDELGCQIAPSSPRPLVPSGLAPCGVCDSCRRIAAGTHPDVHVIVPGSKSGQNISVEQMRDVRQDVARRPIMGRRKLYLMPAAEAMNEEAANTLLKTLEEPPEYVTLVLMVASPTRVLPTVLSRCQIVPFGLAPAGAIRDWLQSNGVAADAAAALAYSAAGRPGLALRWSREPEILERRRQVLRLLDETSAFRRRARQNPGEAVAALRLAERARALAGPAENTGGPEPGEGARRRPGSRERPQTLTTPTPEHPSADENEPAARATAKPAFMALLDMMRGYYRDLLLLAQEAPEALVGNADALTTLRAAVEQYTPADLLGALESVNRSQQFIERNVAPQLALEILFFDLLQADRSTVTGTVPARW